MTHRIRLLHPQHSSNPPPPDRASCERVLRAQEAIRRQVAERLHGTVQGRLVVVSQWLASARAQTDDTHPAAAMLDRCAAVLDDLTRQELRTLVRQLHPAIIRLGLLPALQSLARPENHDCPVDVRFVPRGAEAERVAGTGLAQDLRLAIYRIAEEAVLNARKHAAATRIAITLDMPAPASVSIHVRDNGRGYDLARAQRGLGLLSMQDYCQIHDGSLRLESKPGRSALVHAAFPLRWADVSTHRAA